jgi:hypothetical protein
MCVCMAGKAMQLECVTERKNQDQVLLSGTLVSSMGLAFTNVITIN